MKTKDKEKLSPEVIERLETYERLCKEYKSYEMIEGSLTSEENIKKIDSIRMRYKKTEGFLVSEDKMCLFFKQKKTYGHLSHMIYH